MASQNLDKVRHLAPDLQEQSPREPSAQLGGFELAARTLDKCRASLAGTQGDYQFNCPMDQEFFGSSGIQAEDFRDFVATGASDEEVGEWIAEHAQSPHR
jgi:hypothetical protein